ncbi:hypothetical protein OH824_00925 [Streptomyces canus]|nr:hypothetical protein OH824_00925 [Streptomyces canus]
MLLGQLPRSRGLSGPWQADRQEQRRHAQILSRRPSDHGLSERWIAAAARSPWQRSDCGSAHDLHDRPLTWTFTWDAEDRPTQVQAPGDVCWRYFYDALGRRIAKHRLRADGRIEDVTTYCWDGGHLAEQHTNGVTLVWDYSGLHPLAQREAKTQAQDGPAAGSSPSSPISPGPHRPHRLSGTIAWPSRKYSCPGRRRRTSLIRSGEPGSGRGCGR